jgi:hypothetical protein
MDVRLPAGDVTEVQHDCAIDPATPGPVTTNTGQPNRQVPRTCTGARRDRATT